MNLIKTIFTICIIIIFHSAVYSQKDTCFAGIYIMSLTDFQIEDQSFKADFWIWFNYKNDSLKFQDAIEITNAKSVEYSNYSVEKKSGFNWVQMKCKAVISKDWDVSSFPFDGQKLSINIEHTLYDLSELMIIADSGNSKIDSALKLDDWSILSLRTAGTRRIYNTTFGDPTRKGNSSYPGILSEINIKREHSWNILFKMLTGVYVAFSIVLLAFFVKPSDRLGLCVGGLFAAVGNKYVTEAVVPSSTSNTLFDSIHNITFISILIILILSVIVFKLTVKEDAKKTRAAAILDKTSFRAITLIYILLNIILILNAKGG